MNNNLKYTVEIIKDADKLNEAFSLRFHVYKTAYPFLTKHHALPYEYDAFDCRSIHVGLYCSNNREKTLAGYCRLIIPESCSHTFS